MMVGFYVRTGFYPRCPRAIFVNVRRDAWLVYGTEARIPRTVARISGRAAREVVAVGREGHKMMVHFA